MKKISVVVPLYNEEGNVKELYSRLKKIFDSELSIFDREFIFVNDGSVDKTKEILIACAALDSTVEIISFTRNFGQHPAMLAGLQQARGDYVVLMDGDLQNPPEEIPKLVEKIEEGYDIVYGTRDKRHDPLLRRVGSWIFHRLLRMLVGLKKADVGTPLRIISCRVVQELLKIPGGFRYIAVTMSWLGFNSSYVVTRHNARKFGVSRYSYWRCFKIIVELVMSFSPRILRLITAFGLLLAVGGFFLGGYYLLVKLLYDYALPGYTSIVVLITFFFGVLFIFLGIISEYIAKLFYASLGRPYYVVDKVITYAEPKKTVFIDKHPNQEYHHGA